MSKVFVQFASNFRTEDLQSGQINVGAEAEVKEGETIKSTMIDVAAQIVDALNSSGIKAPRQLACKVVHQVGQEPQQLPCNAINKEDIIQDVKQEMERSQIEEKQQKKTSDNIKNNSISSAQKHGNVYISSKPATEKQLETVLKFLPYIKSSMEDVCNEFSLKKFSDLTNAHVQELFARKKKAFSE